MMIFSLLKLESWNGFRISSHGVATGVFTGEAISLVLCPALSSHYKDIKVVEPLKGLEYKFYEMGLRELGEKEAQ